MRLQALSVLALGLFVVALARGGEEKKGGKKGDVPPEARPVVVWLEAVKEGDTKKLKTAFSERMQEPFAKAGWDKVLKAYQEVFTKAFGDYRLEDFSFKYKGDTKEGRVAISFKDKEFPGVRVVKEKNEWRVDPEPEVPKEKTDGKKGKEKGKDAKKEKDG